MSWAFTRVVDSQPTAHTPCRGYHFLKWREASKSRQHRSRGVATSLQEVQMITSHAGLGNVVVRLTILENENRRLRRLITGLALLTIGSVVYALMESSRPGIAQASQSSLQTIQAYEYILSDSAGKTRAHLFFSDATGSPSLTFYDSVGRTRLSIWADDESTSVVAYSPNGGRFQTNMGASKSSATVQATKLEKGANEQAAYLFTSNDATQLTAYDKNGFRTIVGNAAVGSSAQGKTQWTNAASLVMYQKDGHVLWQSDSHGQPSCR